MSATAPVQAPEGQPPVGTVEQALFGRFMLPDTSEHPCQVHSISVEGATFLAAHAPAMGQTIVAYLEELGRIEATSAERVDGGFRVTFSLNNARRERLETRLRWLMEKNKNSTAEDRRHARFEPREQRSQITMPDGREYHCEVMDISLSGAAVKVEVMPSLGTQLLLGKMRGRVVRYLENGIGIEFVKPLERTELHEQVR